MSELNTTYCVKIGHFNNEYCGIKKQWEPRLTKTASFACVVFPAFFSVMCTAVGLPIIWRNYNRLNLRETAESKMKKPTSDSRLSQMFYRYKVNLVVYIIPVIPLVWDSIDVVLDGVYFYNIEQGGMISNNITRNVHVNNCLVMFASFGALKTPLLVLLIGRFWDVLFHPKDDFTYKMIALSPSSIGNLYVSMVIYITENCVELFLEYFWIEKYVSEHPSSGLVLRNILSALVSVVPLITQIFKLKDRLYIAEQIDTVKQQIKKRSISRGHVQVPQEEVEEAEIKGNEEKSKRQKIFICWVSLSVISLMSTIGSFLRAIGAVYHLVYHKIPQQCLYVTEDGLLYQSPLDDKCMRFIDFTVIFFNFLPLLAYILIALTIIIFKLYGMMCQVGNADQSGQILSINDRVISLPRTSKDNLRITISIIQNEH